MSSALPTGAHAAVVAAPAVAPALAPPPAHTPPSQSAPDAPAHKKIKVKKQEQKLLDHHGNQIGFNLTLAQKCDIIEKLEGGALQNKIAYEYHKSTAAISKIWKAKEEIKASAKEHPGDVKAVRLAEAQFPILDACLFNWYSAVRAYSKVRLNETCTPGCVQFTIAHIVPPVTAGRI